MKCPNCGAEMVWRDDDLVCEYCDHDVQFRGVGGSASNSAYAERKRELQLEYEKEFNTREDALNTCFGLISFVDFGWVLWYIMWDHAPGLPPFAFVILTCPVIFYVLRHLRRKKKAFFDQLREDL